MDVHGMDCRIWGPSDGTVDSHGQSHLSYGTVGSHRILLADSFQAITLPARRPITLRSSVPNFWNQSPKFDNMTSDQLQQKNILTTDHHSIRLWVAISWQLKSSLTYVVFLAYYYSRRPCMPVVNSRFRLCTSLIPRPVIFGLETRLHVCMRTKLENGVLCNRQQPQSVVNRFYWPGWIWSYEDTECS